jgi:hypoxanthine phosphoribosyltransferase
MTELLDKQLPKIEEYKFDEIVAVVRGGLTAAHYIAKQLRLPVGVYYPSNDAYNTPRLILAKKKANRLLFVEDLVAKGRTYDELYKFMKGFPGVEWHFMPVLVDGEYKGDFPFQCLKTDEWIVFPYEKFDKMQEGDRGLFRMNTDVYGV